MYEWWIGRCRFPEAVRNTFRSVRTILTQKYISHDFESLPIPLGQKIETFIEFIRTTNNEYLVHMEWFVRQMKLHNIHMYTPSNHPIFTNGTAAFGNIFTSISKINKKI
jgi:hypothetical protein